MRTQPSSGQSLARETPRLAVVGVIAPVRKETHVAGTKRAYVSVAWARAFVPKHPRAQSSSVTVSALSFREPR